MPKDKSKDGFFQGLLLEEALLRDVERGTGGGRCSGSSSRSRSRSCCCCCCFGALLPLVLAAVPGSVVAVEALDLWIKANSLLLGGSTATTRRLILVVT